MTNSPATALRSRRTKPARALFILGCLFVLATIPIFLLIKSANFNFGDLGKIFHPAAKVTAPAATSASILPNGTNLANKGSDTAAYVQALDNAARKLSQEITKSPSDPALQNRLGLIYLTLGDSKSAEQCFTNAVTLSRGAITTYAAQIEKAKQAGKMTDASNLMLEASKISVELSAAHSNLARVYDQRGDRQAVVAQLDQITRDGLLLNGLASASGQLKSKDGMLSGQDAQLLSQAEALFKTNQLAPALAQYRKLAQSNPKLAFVYDRIGIISVMTGDVNSGIESWEQALKLDPNSAGIRSNLGLAYHQVGMDKEAEASFRHALALDPAMEEAALNLGEILSARGDMNGAIAVMQESSKHCPGSARAANNLGTLLSLSGSYADAMSAFHKAIQLDPNMASAHYGMGVALMKTHKYMPAVRELKVALALNPAMQDAQAKIEEAHRLAGIRG